MARVVDPKWRKVGDRVRAARESVGLSRIELGQALLPKRMGAYVIGDVERGERELAGHEADAIEEICNADSGYLLTGRGKLHGGQPNITSLDASVQVKELTQLVCELLDRVERLESAAGLKPVDSHHRDQLDRILRRTSRSMPRRGESRRRQSG